MILLERSIFTKPEAQSKWKSSKAEDKIALLKDKDLTIFNWDKDNDPRNVYAGTIVSSIDNNGDNDISNLFLAFVNLDKIKNLPSGTIDPTKAELLNNLFNKNIIDLNTDWIEDPRAYRGSSYKLRALAFLSSEEASDFYTNPKKVMEEVLNLRDENSIKYTINNLQDKKGTIKIKGYKIIQNALKITSEISENYLISYIIKILEEKIKGKKDISERFLFDVENFKRILSTKEKNFLIGKGEIIADLNKYYRESYGSSPEKQFNNELFSDVKSILKLDSSTTTTTSSKNSTRETKQVASKPKLTGYQAISAKTGIEVNENSDEETLRRAFREWALPELQVNLRYNKEQAQSIVDNLNNAQIQTLKQRIYEGSGNDEDLRRRLERWFRSPKGNI